MNGKLRIAKNKNRDDESFFDLKAEGIKVIYKNA